MNEQEYQEIKRRWDNKHSEINKLIAYCEELREINKEVEHEISFIEDLNTKLLEANAGWREENEKLKDELNEAGLNW